MTLKIEKVKDPHDSSQVLLFRDTQSALKHIRDHLLTAPECDAWALIFEHIQGHDDEAEVSVVSADARIRQKISRQIFSDTSSAAPLYDLYQRVICYALRGWRAHVASSAAAFSPLGVLVYMQDPQTRPAAHKTPVREVTSAYLPGAGRPFSERAKTNDGPLLRREAPRTMRKKRGGRAVSGREMREKRQRRDAMSPEARIFHEVFKESVRALRRRVINSGAHERARDPEHLLLDRELLSRLPRPGELSFEGWLKRVAALGIKGSVADDK